jgi:hypothetical protein
LTNFSTLLKFSQFNLPKRKTHKIYFAGEFYEKGSPEVANSKGIWQILLLVGYFKAHQTRRCGETFVSCVPLWNF